MTLEARPRRLRTVCRLTAGVVVLVFGAVAVLLPRGAVGGRAFGVADQLLFFGTGLALAGAVLLFTRFRVRGDDTGLWVRNAGRERYFPWPVVEGVVMLRDAPWAELMLHDDQRVALMALQSHDGDHAAQGVRALEELRARAGHPHGPEQTGPSGP